jgi:hypothetical protein
MKIYAGEMSRIESEVVLGMDWLEAANPKINWINKVISPGSIIPNNGQVSTFSRASIPYSSLQTPFQQTVISRRTESPLHELVHHLEDVGREMMIHHPTSLVTTSTT